MIDSGLPAPCWSIGQCATIACLLEVTAPKPGNVHRGRDYEDVSYLDFALSAVALAPAMEQAAAGGRVGAAILAAVRAMRQCAASNTYLGTILLLAPLAAVPRAVPLAEGISTVLQRLNAADAADVYQAIQLAHPGGMGKVANADVAGPAPTDLLAAMRMASDRDLVARQYANGFQTVLEQVTPWLQQEIDQGWPLADCIVRAFLRLMSEYPDSLIARKCGPEVAEQAARWAARVLARGTPASDDYHAELADFDFWLRSDGNRRNPGTSADLIAAALFAMLRDGQLRLPARFSADD